MQDAAISLDKVAAGYGGKAVLEGISFNIKRGEIFILLGGSGCGKTTLMRHMIGLNPVVSGRLLVSGMEWSARNRATLCRKIGVMFQSGALFGSMTCLENVLLPLEEFSGLKRREREEKAMSLLESVELADAAGKMPSEISGGMRKRVAIARAMALDLRKVGLRRKTGKEETDRIFKSEIERGLRATVVSSGITGLSRIELNIVTNAPPAASVAWRTPHPVVPPAPSLMENLSDAATHIVNELNKLDFTALWNGVGSAARLAASLAQNADALLESQKQDIGSIVETAKSAVERLDNISRRLEDDPSLLLRGSNPERLPETSVR